MPSGLGEPGLPSPGLTPPGPGVDNLPFGEPFAPPEEEEPVTFPFGEPTGDYDPPPKLPFEAPSVSRSAPSAAPAQGPALAPAQSPEVKSRKATDDPPPALPFASLFRRAR